MAVKDPDHQVDRLLRAAALAQPHSADEMPFGFDTRLFARWREERSQDLVDVGRLLRRVAILSLGIIVLGSDVVYHELQQSDQAGTPLTDEYAIADNVIGGALQP
jgi:hypothetical protein